MRRSWAACALGGCWLALAPPLARAQSQSLQSQSMQSQAWGMAGLMAQLAQVRAATATFTEQKTLHLLTAPLTDTGTLTYAAPDQLEKKIFAPVPEDFRLQGDAARYTGPDQQVRTFSLRQAPQLAGLVEGIRDVLAGDAPALQRFYAIRLSGGPAHWQLLLRPRDQQLSAYLAWMAVTGSGARITGIDSASGNGDHAEMRVTETLTGTAPHAP